MDGPQSKAPTDKRDHPYRHQPDHAFWRRTVQDVYPLDIGHWYKKKFSLAGRKLATGGSCFAQHIGRELKRQGSAYLDVEPAPGFLPPSLHLDYGYRRMLRLRDLLGPVREHLHLAAVAAAAPACLRRV